jgi:hypothetical protein
MDRVLAAAEVIPVCYWIIMKLQRSWPLRRNFLEAANDAPMMQWWWSANAQSAQVLVPACTGAVITSVAMSMRTLAQRGNWHFHALAFLQLQWTTAAAASRNSIPLTWSCLKLSTQLVIARSLRFYETCCYGL